MVNYKRVVCESVMVLALVAAAAAAPPADCEQRHHYDQRQNGSENYRLNIDGVVIAVAPAESLLAAASDIDFGELLGDLDDFNDLKPKPPATADKPPNPLEPKPQDPKPQDAKPEDPKPDPKPEGPLSDVSLPNEVKGQRKEVRKQEKAQRLKMRLANMLLPLLRRNRHH